MRSIYISSLQDPTFRTTTTDFITLQEQARAKLPAAAYGYVAGSASTESTEKNNREAFERWEIGESTCFDHCNSPADLAGNSSLQSRAC